MLRIAAMLSLLLASALGAQPVTAQQADLQSVELQTRDGQPWTAGKPVTLVVRVAAAGDLPASAQAVVMQTDGDRTKCLGVPLKLVESGASGGLYAGVFFPFRAARYDGKLSIGEDLHDITFDVNHMLAGPAPEGDLPAAEPLDTSAPSVVISDELWLLLAGAIVAAASLATLAARRTPRTA